VTVNLDHAEETLAAFILRNMEPILADWESFARSQFPQGYSSKTRLRDHAKDMLLAVVEDMREPQTPMDQEDKSKGLLPNNSPSLKAAGEQHAVQRAKEQFDWEQLIGEFRAMRASVLRHWSKACPTGTGRIEEISRFNEAVDEVLASSVRCYAGKLEEARDVIIGVLAHDLRSPLHAAKLSASYILQSDSVDAKCATAAARVVRSVSKMGTLIADLLDYARVRLAHGIPIARQACDLQVLCSDSVDEVESAHPGRTIKKAFSGDLTGNWDPSRIGQLGTNLLNNALTHGYPHSEVLITATAAATAVSIEVFNEGAPIPSASSAVLFEPLHRMPFDPLEQASDGSSGLRLGLYITRQIAIAHGGTISVTSSAELGTRFKVDLPRVGRTADAPRAKQLDDSCSPIASKSPPHNPNGTNANASSCW
jgi:signal transduction histidine kinase